MREPALAVAAALDVVVRRPVGLQEADLREADLRPVDLREVDLREVDLQADPDAVAVVVPAAVEAVATFR